MSEKQDIRNYLLILDDIANHKFVAARDRIQLLNSNNNSISKLLIAESYIREGFSLNYKNAEEIYSQLIDQLSNKLTIFPYILDKLIEINFSLYNFSSENRNFIPMLINKYGETVDNLYFKIKFQIILDVINENIADHNLLVAYYYYKNEHLQFAKSRLLDIINKNTQYSKLDEVIWLFGLIEEKSENNGNAVSLFNKIVSEYPNSKYKMEAVNKLKYHKAELTENKYQMQNNYSIYCNTITIEKENLKTYINLRAGIFINLNDKLNTNAINLIKSVINY